MKINGFGERIIENDEDWRRFDFKGLSFDQMYAVVGTTGEDDPNDQFFAQILENVEGETVANVRGFATVGEVRAFIAKNAPDLEIQGA